MFQYTIRRLLQSVFVLVGVTLLVFLMLHAMPDDPVMNMLISPEGGAGAHLTAEVTEQMYNELKRQLGLDRPLPVQYWSFLVGALQGDFGRSHRSGRTVQTLVARNLPYTVQLAGFAIVIAAVVGVFQGVLAAAMWRTWVDTASVLVSVFFVSMPTFWLGIMLILIFGVQLRWLPVMGAEGWQYALLPSFAMGIRAAALIARLTRANLIDVMQQDYVRTARAKGQIERIVLMKHGLKNALIPVVTVLGLQFGSLLAGALYIEVVFARPGIGRLATQGILDRDFPLVQGVILVIAAMYVLLNLLIDLSYALLDPRIRYA